MMNFYFQHVIPWLLQEFLELRQVKFTFIMIRYIHFYLLFHFLTFFYRSLKEKIGLEWSKKKWDKYCIYFHKPIILCLNCMFLFQKKLKISNSLFGIFRLFWNYFLWFIFVSIRIIILNLKSADLFNLWLPYFKRRTEPKLILILLLLWKRR